MDFYKIVANEYMLTELGLYYKVDGKLYLTSMYELEFC